MSVNMSSRLPLGLASPLADWHESNIDKTPQPFSMVKPSATPMRLLSAVELATLQVEACPHPTSAPPYSTLGEASIRLRMWGLRGVLEYMSGDYLARCLQEVWWPYSHPRALRRPWRGLELLRQLDLYSDTTGTTVWLSAEPSNEDPLRFRRLRLHERISELTRANA